MKRQRATSWESTLGSLQRAQFAMIDVLRRAQGFAIGAFGLDPQESPYRVIASGPNWRLRDYGGGEARHPLLIVAAPIKRPYIWDLTPSASAIRYCLRNGHRVYLIEWLPATHLTADCGLEEYVQAIARCVAGMGARKPALIGHSLGGTLAAIFAAADANTIQALVLLAAPLCFSPRSSRFRDALIALTPPGMSESEPCPGSLLSQVSIMAAPETFVWARLIDAASSLGDREALELHARVERWALDEVALPGRLVREILDWLYRENRLCAGSLEIGGRTIGPSRLTAPTLAVVNVSDQVAPTSSIAPFLDAMPIDDVRMVEYEGDVGVALQHLGILIGRQAFSIIWPQIMAFLDRHARDGACHVAAAVQRNR